MLNCGGIPPTLWTLCLYTCDAKTDTRYTDTLHGPYTYPCIIVVTIVCVMRDLDHALSNALQWLGTPEVIIKSELRSCDCKVACGCLPTGFGKSLCFQMLLFVLIVCQGRSVLLVLVWLWPFCRHLASSCSWWTS